MGPKQVVARSFCTCLGSTEHVLLELLQSFRQHYQRRSSEIASGRERRLEVS